ncbi:hypothetical protein QZH41_015884 [Actinostola sp. cb2023]|nr:hypothetical protein QZH41_015884 [Actinostola sp. cb2023]
MKYITAWKKVLFVCSPVISGLDEMISLGLYMSDLGIYDSSQEMLLTGITPLPQLEYARDQLIEKCKILEENLIKLDEERKRSDELLYRMMPKPIADRLKNGAKAIDTCEYFESVTVLFSYLDGFFSLCSSVDAMEVVALVDNMFTIFDCLSEKYDVHKFETLGDAVYMAVSGAPVRKMRHAEPMAAMALAMIESMNQFKKDCGRETLTITVGKTEISTYSVLSGLYSHLTLAQRFKTRRSMNVYSGITELGLPVVS